MHRRQMRQVLHFQADRIELVLASHKVPARVTGGKVTSRLVRFQLSTPLGVKVKQVAGLAEELALSLGAPSCRVYRQEGQMQVEVPRSDGQVVHLLDLCRRLAAQGWGAPGERPADQVPAGIRPPGRGLKGTGRNMLPPVTAVLGLDGEGVPLLLRLPSWPVPMVSRCICVKTADISRTGMS